MSISRDHLRFFCHLCNCTNGPSKPSQTCRCSEGAYFIPGCETAYLHRNNCEWFDEDKYDEAFQAADWDQMEAEDKTLWLDLGKFPEYPNQGPEKFRLVNQEVSNESSLSKPEFSEYLSCIRLNIPEVLLNNVADRLPCNVFV